MLLACLPACLRAAPSPRLQRCVAAAKAAGASEDWLAEKYGSIRKGSAHGHQAFRILCCAGPGGCGAWCVCVVCTRLLSQHRQCVAGTVDLLSLKTCVWQLLEP